MSIRLGVLVSSTLKPSEFMSPLCCHTTNADAMCSSIVKKAALTAACLYACMGIHASRDVGAWMHGVTRFRIL